MLEKSIPFGTVTIAFPFFFKWDITNDKYIHSEVERLKSEDINLTGKEFDLFYALITNPGKIFTRERLLELVWGYAYFGDLRTVDVHIRRIREKIETDTKETKYIMTKWGEGYYFTKNA